jgi:hypothetical protein
MRPRWHRKNLVVWSSSAGPSRWPGVTGQRPVRRRPRRGPRSRFRRRIRTGALVTVIGLARLARVAHARPGLAFLLSGALLVAAGNLLPSGVAVIAGMMISLRGAAVLLGVSEPRRSEPRHRPDGQPPRAADFFGFGTPPPDQGYPGQG